MLPDFVGAVRTRMGVKMTMDGTGSVPMPFNANTGTGLGSAGNSALKEAGGDTFTNTATAGTLAAGDNNRTQKVEKDKMDSRERNAVDKNISRFLQVRARMCVYMSCLTPLLLSHARTH